MFEAIVIGTGFGGSITSCRLSRQWPEGKVLILERGRRYPMGSFQRSPRDTIRNLWNVSDEKRTPLPGLLPADAAGDDTLGVFDLRGFRHMDVLVGAGFGGGSLIYSNVFMVPPAEIFDERWPESCRLEQLAPYYEVAREVLGARPVPQSQEPRREIIRTAWFQEVAGELGRKSELTDINVFFGNDFDEPLPLGVQDRNRYGALQTSCIYCGECNIGCNTHSKNTLDLNYLFVAEERYRARVLTQHRAEWIIPLGVDGAEEPSADGRHGYRVYYKDLSPQGKQDDLLSATTKRVIVSAGSLGTTELLLKCRDRYQSLPGISQKLGHSFSGNGDFLGFAIQGKRPVNPNYGPVITQRIDFNLFEQFDREHAFLLEDGGYPPLLAWLVEGFKPRFMSLGSLIRFLRNMIDRWLRRRAYGSTAYAVADLLAGEFSTHSTFLQFMGVDASSGRLKLDQHGEIEIEWPYQESLPLYQRINETIKSVGRSVSARWAIPFPAWNWPSRRNLSVHLLGGCAVADRPADGVTSADPNSFGQVFGYQGLYVADGSLLPAAVGANPCATISAMAEMVAHGICGRDGPMPGADL